MEKKTFSKGHVKVIQGATGMFTIWDMETSKWITLNPKEAECLYDGLAELLDRVRLEDLPESHTVVTTEGETTC